MTNANKANLIEHQRSLSYLIQQARMPHAFIISGVQGIGKLTLAHWLIGVLACEQCISEKNKTQQDILYPCNQCKSCQLLGGQGHPDHIIVEHSTNNIGVDQIRKITTFFEKTALLGKTQSTIIASAEKMTESAANALLKTLEEPSAQSHLILLTTEIERLIPTIISRCRHIAIRATTQAKNQDSPHNKPTTFVGLVADTDNAEAALFNDFSLLFYQFLAQPEQHSKLLSFMQAQSMALNWSEQLIADLMRFNQGWLNVTQDTEIEQQTLARLQHLTHDDIWQLQLFNSACKKQILFLAQANKDFQIEMLLSQMKHYLIQAYIVDR